MPKEPESIPVTEGDLSEALGAVEALMAGKGPVTPNPDNPLLAGILASLEDNALDGYLRGRPYTEPEVRALPIGAVLWIRWCKDNDPNDCRFDGAYQITAVNDREFEVHTGEEWRFDGETSRGIAHYSEARKVTKAEVREFKRQLRRALEKPKAKRRRKR